MTDTLADAAALMRERAHGATPGPWKWAEQTHDEWYGLQSEYAALGNLFTPGDAFHVASWSPAVALAVADLIDWHATHDVGGPSWRLAHAVAGAYLGVGAS